MNNLSENIARMKNISLYHMVRKNIKFSLVYHIHNDLLSSIPNYSGAIEKVMK